MSSLWDIIDNICPLESYLNVLFSNNLKKYYLCILKVSKTIFSLLIIQGKYLTRYDQGFVFLVDLDPQFLLYSTINAGGLEWGTDTVEINWKKIYVMSFEEYSSSWGYANAPFICRNKDKMFP